jgi:nucleotide sugar dehydrogenase
MRISVIGMGKIGLPVAVQYASKGHEVIGCDIDARLVTAINEGTARLGVPDMDELLAEQWRAGRIRASTDTAAAVAETDVTVLLVPVLVADGAPDYRHMDAAAEQVAEGLGADHLVVFETTFAVGTTRSRYLPMLSKSGHTPGEDLFIAFSPERVQSHRVIEDLRRYPKVVGGVDPASGERARRFYDAVLDAPVLMVRDAETAEFTKLAESVYRDVNIALANELARYAHDVEVDIGDVIAAANSEPLSQLHQPGAGVGGHCIPVYPYFILAERPDMEMIGLARRINDAMPGWVLERVAGNIGGLQGKRVLVLGLSYRADVREVSHSVGLSLVEGLRAAGATAVGADTGYSNEEIARFGAEPFEEATLGDLDAVIVQAFHTPYRRFPWEKLRPGTLVVDGRNVLDPSVIRNAGCRYLGVGRGGPVPRGESEVAVPDVDYGAA